MTAICLKQRHPPFACTARSCRHLCLLKGGAGSHPPPMQKSFRQKNSLLSLLLLLGRAHTAWGRVSWQGCRGALVCSCTPPKQPVLGRMWDLSFQLFADVNAGWCKGRTQKSTFERGPGTGCRRSMSATPHCTPTKLPGPAESTSPLIWFLPKTELPLLTPGGTRTHNP